VREARQVILIEADSGEDWDSSTDWSALADRAARAAVGASKHAHLIDATLAVEISVKFTSDSEVQSLNAGYRSKDKPTNVLSFPMVEPEMIDAIAGAGEGELLLGDIVLAHAVCAREAEEKGVAVSAHAIHLVVHGTLHLLGYDHETGEDDAEAMEAVERSALASLGIADPYQVTEV
jgi:probable rRNA maturation factor